MKFLSATVAVAAATTFVLIPSPAGADTLQKYDRWKDVLQVDTTEEPGPHFFGPAPDRVIGDITETRVDHRSTVVHVAVYVRSLLRAGDSNSFNVVLKTTRLSRTVEITAAPGAWGGRLRYYSNASGAVLHCSGIRYTIEYSHERLVLDIPRRCLGSPDFVRVGASTQFEVSRTQTLYADDAFTSQSDFYRPVLGPTVYR